LSSRVQGSRGGPDRSERDERGKKKTLGFDLQRSNQKKGEIAMRVLPHAMATRNLGQRE